MLMVLAGVLHRISVLMEPIWYALELHVLVFILNIGNNIFQSSIYKLKNLLNKFNLYKGMELIVVSFLNIVKLIGIKT